MIHWKQNKHNLEKNELDSKYHFNNHNKCFHLAEKFTSEKEGMESFQMKIHGGKCPEASNFRVHVNQS